MSQSTMKNPIYNIFDKQEQEHDHDNPKLKYHCLLRWLSSIVLVVMFVINIWLTLQIYKCYVTEYDDKNVPFDDKSSSSS